MVSVQKFFRNELITALLASMLCEIMITNRYYDVRIKIDYYTYDKK